MWVYLPWRWKVRGWEEIRGEPPRRRGRLSIEFPQWEKGGKRDHVTQVIMWPLPAPQPSVILKFSFAFNSQIFLHLFLHLPEAIIKIDAISVRIITRICKPHLIAYLTIIWEVKMAFRTKNGRQRTSQDTIKPNKWLCYLNFAGNVFIRLQHLRGDMESFLPVRKGRSEFGKV